VSEPTGDLSSPLSWCFVAIRQAERVRESYAAWRAVKVVGEESDELDYLYWGDVRFLISATHHMSEALDGLPSGPKLPQRLKDQMPQLRHMLEHWGGDDEGKGGWKSLVTKYPAGRDLISLDELEQVLIRVRGELLEVYPVKAKWLEVYHGRPQLIEADVRGRAVLRAWLEMLERHEGRSELIDREQFRARVAQLLELNREREAPLVRDLDAGGSTSGAGD